MTRDELTAFYGRYNACCNAHSVRAFPDYTWELRRLVVDAPWIAAHLTDTGTHRAEFHGVQATGRSVAIPEFAFYRVDAGTSPRCGARASTRTCFSKSGSPTSKAAGMQSGCRLERPRA